MQLTVNAGPLASVSRLTFRQQTASDGTDVLFVADWIGARLHAFVLAAPPPAADQFVALRRNLKTGKAEVIGIPTCLLLRMGDWHPREYDFISRDNADHPRDDAAYWTPQTEFDSMAMAIYQVQKDREGIPEWKQTEPPGDRPAGAAGGGMPTGNA